jgi:hypothetical protein
MFWQLYSLLVLTSFYSHFWQYLPGAESIGFSISSFFPRFNLADLLCRILKAKLSNLIIKVQTCQGKKKTEKNSVDG